MNNEARSIPISYGYAIHNGVNHEWNHEACHEANHEVDESCNQWASQPMNDYVVHHSVMRFHDVNDIE